MTKAVQKLLESFDALTDEEKQAATAEVVRRSILLDQSALSDDELISAAEALFLQLDAREAGNGDA